MAEKFELKSEYNLGLVPVGELQVGDVIMTHGGSLGAPWNTGIVQKVTAEKVKVFRPYGHHADFSYGGDDDCEAVICYTGVEWIEYLRSSGLQFLVHRRTKLK